MLANIGNKINTEGEGLIGNNGEVLGKPGKALSHAVLSGITAEIERGNGKGAAAGALAAELTGIILDDNTIKGEEWEKIGTADTESMTVWGFLWCCIYWSVGWSL